MRISLQILLYSLIGVLPFNTLYGIQQFPATPKAFGSTRFRLEVNGEPVFVHKFKDVHYAHFPFQGVEETEIRITPRVPFETLRISPKSHGINMINETGGGSGVFRMREPGKLVVTLDERERLFLFAEDMSREDSFQVSGKVINAQDYGADPNGVKLSTFAIQEAIDKAKPGDMVRFPIGHYLSGSLIIKSGITFWLDAGALLQAVGDPAKYDSDINGFIQVMDAEEVRIAGLGTIDGSGAYLRHLTNAGGRLIYIRDSSDVVIEGLILRNPRAWNTHIVRSENVKFRNVKLLNDRDVSNTDGINPDSSRYVLIEDSFLYCGDDNVAVKSTNQSDKFQDVHDIVVRNNVMLTKKSALKVGTETHATEMHNILFENNEVIECDRGMSLYARDGTRMHDVRFIGNRFEEPYYDYYQRLIHFEVKKRYGLSTISNVLIKDCQADVAWPQTSLIKGFSKDHGISNVVIENLTIAGRKVSSPKAAKIEIGQYAEIPKFK
jgi:hypothetical protein